eukprot:2774080-Pyramimonas_sp.AAC.2
MHPKERMILRQPIYLVEQQFRVDYATGNATPTRRQGSLRGFLRIKLEQVGGLDCTSWKFTLY